MEKIIELHEEALEHLERVKHYRTRQNSQIELIESFYSGFPALIKKAAHNIEIFKKCENRMWERYEKALGEIQRLKIQIKIAQ